MIPHMEKVQPAGVICVSYRADTFPVLCKNGPEQQPYDTEYDTSHISENTLIYRNCKVAQIWS